MAESDPRKSPRAVADVPSLVVAGALEFNARRYWHAHEAWEEGWHALRAAGLQARADFLQGMILVAAGFENAVRGKEAGFRRQSAKGLAMMRGNLAEGVSLGLAEPAAWVDAVTTYYLAGASRQRLEDWTAVGVDAPKVKTR